MTKFLITSVADTDLKKLYRDSLNAPLDGMWTSFVEMGQCWTITLQANPKDVIGYCVVNADNQLLQYNVMYECLGRDIFTFILAEFKLSGAFVSTVEYGYLSYCLDHQKSVKVNAFMYHENFDPYSYEFPQGFMFEKVTLNMFDEVMVFGLAVLGCSSDWLKGYYNERIEKGELFGLRKGGVIVATGECRLRSDHLDYADVGMMVAQEYRGQGLATNILKKLRYDCNARGLKAICSTEFENIPAQKSIEKSGFISTHRIIEIEF